MRERRLRRGLCPRPGGDDAVRPEDLFPVLQPWALIKRQQRLRPVPAFLLQGLCQFRVESLPFPQTDVAVHGKADRLLLLREDIKNKPLIQDSPGVMPGAQYDNTPLVILRVSLIPAQKETAPVIEGAQLRHAAQHKALSVVR